MELSASAWDHCLECAALSDLGLRRANNQDAYAVVLADGQRDFQRRGHFFMVADGMGAHAAGELASKMATDVVSLSYRKQLDQSPTEAILSAVLHANGQIHTRGVASDDFRGMGTTATTLILLPAGAIVAHVGDSRAYRLRGTRIDQLTFDHSLVWEIRAAGKMSEAEVPGYITKNIITRSLGPNDTVKVDLEGPFPVQAGDTFLLCSDGLSGQVTDDEIGLVLSCLPPSEAVRALVDLANLRGGPDNITVVVVNVLGPQTAPTTVSDSASMKETRRTRPVSPLVWTGLGVAGLGTAWMLAMGHYLAALIGLLATGAAAVAAWLQRYGGVEQPFEFDQRQLGKGPYVTSECAPSTDLLARLTNIIRQLREAAVKGDWAVDWTALEGYQSRAASATVAGKLNEAARQYLHAITSLMAQLRRPQTTTSDSGVLPLL
jgi:PPM family protein phosphatase